MNAVSGGKTKKSVLGVLLVAENTPKQLSIRCLLHKHGLVKLLDDVAHLAGCHGNLPLVLEQANSEAFAR